MEVKKSLHNMMKMGCSGDVCNRVDCIHFMTGLGGEHCYEKVPFFAIYKEWELRNHIAYKHKDSDLYYVRQSLNKLIQILTKNPSDGPFVWRPHFWALQNRSQ